MRGGQKPVRASRRGSRYFKKLAARFDRARVTSKPRRTPHANPPRTRTTRHQNTNTQTQARNQTQTPLNLNTNRSNSLSFSQLMTKTWSGSQRRNSPVRNLNQPLSSPPASMGFLESLHYGSD